MHVPLGRVGGWGREAGLAVSLQPAQPKTPHVLYSVLCAGGQAVAPTIMVAERAAALLLGQEKIAAGAGVAVPEPALA